MVRRTAIVAAVLFAFVLAACEPAAPPSVGAVHRTAVTFGADESPDLVMQASEGSARLVVWGDDREALRYDRLGGTAPQRTQPLILATSEVGSEQTTKWPTGAVALGNGYALIVVDVLSFDNETPVPAESKLITLRRPDDTEVTLTGPSAGDLASCNDEGGDPAQTVVAWNGTRFLLAKICGLSTRLFTVSTAGAIAEQGSIAREPATGARGDVERHRLRRGVERPAQRQPGHLRGPSES